jgi:hypothetical protein
MDPDGHHRRVEDYVMKHPPHPAGGMSVSSEPSVLRPFRMSTEETRTTVEVAASGAGYLLTRAGEAIAFVPNEVGRSMIHHSDHVPAAGAPAKP